jgi:aminocarboxymuconate-semialdehyde decarboxylase
MEKNQFQGMDCRTFLKTSSAISLGAAATFGAPGGIMAQSVKKYSGEKIDFFCHIIPPKFKEALFKKSRPTWYIENTKTLPALSDLNLRFKAMDKYEGMLQLLDLGMPPIEYAVPPKDAVQLARMANDEMAELVNKYPNRFVGAVAGLPMNDVDAALRETDRAIKELKFKGIQLASSINGKPLDRPEFLGLYEKMAQYDLPIWIHPTKDNDIPDYPDEKFSKYGLFRTFAWPFETTKAMIRLVFSGIMQKYPNLKFIIHHCGAMLPTFMGRVPESPPQDGEVMKLTKPPLEYFKKFYVDTVMWGNTPALMCGYALFGADKMLFASDYPYPGGAAKCDVAVGEVIESVERMNITDEEKAKIFSKNARKILKLS